MFPGVDGEVDVEVELKLLDTEVAVVVALLEILQPHVKESFSMSAVKRFQNFLLQKHFNHLLTSC